MGIILFAEEEQSKHEAWVLQRNKASKYLLSGIFQHRQELNQMQEV